MLSNNLRIPLVLNSPMAAINYSLNTRSFLWVGYIAHVHFISSILRELYKMSLILRTSYQTQWRILHQLWAHLFVVLNSPIIYWMQQNILLDIPWWQSRICWNSPRGCKYWNQACWNDWFSNQPSKWVSAAWSWYSSLSKMLASPVDHQS